MEGKQLLKPYRDNIGIASFAAEKIRDGECRREPVDEVLWKAFVALEICVVGCNEA
jgi:hypothetical protein